MDHRITIITLGVNNLMQTTAFYEDIFGWKRSGESNKDISFFRVNGMLLSLFPRTKLAEDAGLDDLGSGFRGFTLSYNARTTGEVDQLFENFKRKEVQIIKLPQEVFWGGYSGYIADPDGTLWEVAFNPYLTFDNNGHVTGA